MMQREHWFVLASATATVWQESGENPAIFCYLISWDAYAELRSRLLAIIPDTARHESACWNQSFTSSARSTALTDSRN